LVKRGLYKPVTSYSDSAGIKLGGKGVLALVQYNIQKQRHSLKSRLWHYVCVWMIVYKNSSWFNSLKIVNNIHVKVPL